MGTRLTIGGYDFECVDFALREAATPLSAGDSSGSVGDFSATINLPDPNTNPTHPAVLIGSSWLQDKDFTLTDSRLGNTLGTISDVGLEYNNSISITAQTLLGSLNVFNINAQPYTGTLGGAFTYYVSLAGPSLGVDIDPTISSRPVVFPGFSGDLWPHLKQMAVAQDCDVSLVDGMILLRSIRDRVSIRGRDFSRSSSNGGRNLAQSVEVYWYDTETITDQLVYPAGGWTPDVQVYTVGAGETSEYTIELSASLSSLQTPVMQTSVSKTYASSSVYTVIADDGLPVTPGAWTAFGGSVKVSINPDTSSLTLTMVGATDLPLTGGNTARSFSLALSAGASTAYSTLRLVGTGVRYTRDSVIFPTGVTATQTGTEIGETIDNPYINDLDTLYRTGTRAAARYAGPLLGLSGNVSGTTNRAVTGVVDINSYGDVDAALDVALGGSETYAEVQTYYTSTLGLANYRDVQNSWNALTQNDYENQTFGNVQGSRIWDQKTRRYYRIRSGSITPEGVSFDSADDDLIFSDLQTAYSGLTYADLQAARAEMTYHDDYYVGAYSGT